MYLMKRHSQLWFMVLIFVVFSQLIFTCLYSSWYLLVIMSQIYLYSKQTWYVCFDHIFLKVLQAVLKSSIYKPAVWHTWLTAPWTCAWCVKNTDNPLMTVRCRFGLQIVFNLSSFLITTNSHAIFISEVEHRWVYGQIYFQNTLLSGLKIQHIWSMLCCKDIWFSWTHRNSSILFLLLSALSNTAFLSNIRLIWHEWIANHQT